MKNLENLTIHKFRGIKELKLEKLGQINILVGLNNSGKTSVLEALSLYCNPASPRDWISTMRKRDEYMRSSSTLLELLQWLFPQSTRPEEIHNLEEHKISISSDGSFSVQRLEATYEELEGILTYEEKKKKNRNFRRSDETEDDPNELKRGLDIAIEIYTQSTGLAKPELKGNFEFWEYDGFSRISKLGQVKLPVSLVSPSSHRSNIGQFRLVSDARFKNFKSDVLNLLHAMDSDIEDIEILLSPGTFSRFNIYVQHKRVGLAPINTFGDGVRRLLHIALQLASAKDGILLIDEIEVTVHTEALTQSFNWLVKACQEMNVQLFATTHSLEAIDALLETTDTDLDLVLYRLEPYENQTKVIRHDWNRLKILREEVGQEVRW